MTDKEFNERFAGVIGPAYRGAPWPVFDQHGVNEKKFADGLRGKHCDFDLRDDGKLHVEWCSEEPFTLDELDGFNLELLRCLSAIEFKNRVCIHIYDRGGTCDHRYELRA